MGDGDGGRVKEGDTGAYRARMKGEQAKDFMVRCYGADTGSDRIDETRLFWLQDGN